jgi:hypothetical protein
MAVVPFRPWPMCLGRPHVRNGFNSTVKTRGVPENDQSGEPSSEPCVAERDKCHRRAISGTKVSRAVLSLSRRTPEPRSSLGLVSKGAENTDRRGTGHVGPSPGQRKLKGMAHIGNFPPSGPSATISLRFSGRAHSPVCKPYRVQWSVMNACQNRAQSYIH